MDITGKQGQQGRLLYWFWLHFHTESHNPELEETNKDHGAQLLARHRTPQQSHPALERIAKCSRSSGSLETMTTPWGGWSVSDHLLGEEPFPDV